MSKKGLKKDDRQVAMELLATVEQFSDHIIITNKDGLIEYVNPAFERDTGYAKEEVIGKSPDFLSCEKHNEKYHKELWDVLKHGKEVKSSITSKKKNGDLYYSDRLISPIKNDEGEITHFVSIWEDASERRKWEEELETQKWGLEKTNKALRSLYKKLENQNEELVKLDQLKSDFVSTVSHELRTPLAISTEGINLILDGLAGEVSEKQKYLLETSKENLERLNLIINDLLDISKIEAGKVEIRPIFFDLVEHISKIIKSFEPVAAKKKLKLISSLPSKTITVFLDKDKITQVITNLLSNAYKFTGEGGSIEIGLKIRGSEVICSIKDSGVGIEKENIPKLFKKFQQIGREEGPGIKGTGLGLTISKNLIELHKGKIWVESEIGKGTTFLFSLPLYEELKEQFNHQFDVLLDDIATQKKSMGLVITQLSNADEIRVKYGDEKLTAIMNNILLSVNDILSHPDDKVFLYNTHSIYALLPETKFQGACSVINRIKRSIEKSKIKNTKNGIKLDIKFGHSIFPDSAKTRVELIDAAVADISRQKNILVVDDHPQIFRILRSRLKKFGFQVNAAETGKEALKIMKENRPDLVILDIMMPIMSGYEVFGKMKEDPVMKSIPIIILTAKNVETVRQEAPHVGEVPVITKTGSFNVLVDIINKML